MMNLDKYENDGWGLSKLQLTQLLGLFKNSNKEVLRVVEFGSGKSTQFLVDVVNSGVKNLDITSFEDNPKFGYKNTGKHTFLNLKIRGLVECTDESYNKMFTELKLYNNLFFEKQTPLSTRQKNNFYNIRVDDLSGVYDFMILDGPNGNGRNISFLHMKKHLKSGSIILIDDSTHYDFVEKFNLFFNYDILYENETGNIEQWINGGDYKILKIK